jgi:hypothetical protein
MLPFELQGHLIERNGRVRCEQDQANGYGQPSQHVQLLRKRGERPSCRGISANRGGGEKAQ